MEEVKIELERARLKNYILQKENDILMGTIGIMSKEKVEMQRELNKYRKKIYYRVKNRIRNIIKK